MLRPYECPGIPVASVVRLKFITQCELHHAWITHALELSEGSRRGQSKTRIREVHIVEHIEGLGAELNALALPRQLEDLRHRHIGIEHGGQAERGAGPGGG